MSSANRTKKSTSRFSDTPHVSYSQINKYLTCPEKYRLWYFEGLRPRRPSASLVFGKIMHQSLAHLLGEGGDPVAFFQSGWNSAKERDLDYGKRGSWEKLRERGEGLLRTFQDEEMDKLDRVCAVEKPFEIEISGLSDPFVGIIDLVAWMDGKKTLIDFKTSKSSYSGHEAEMSDQLVAYGLAHPGADRTALCVLVKTKTPKIEWHFAEIPTSRLKEYIWKARMVSREVETGTFYKRPGIWCNWCDFLPICRGDDEKATETLVHIDSKASG